ncbi:MAG: DUF1192 domain-containing protein [Acetobacteraceae bacterium]|nr:DUF1192 domain-containing protein [Acetobacteraceae bacterium]
MIDDREEGPRPRTANRFNPPPNLDGWSVEELGAYVAALQAEIARAEAAIARQHSLRSAANAFFKTP